MFNDLMIYFQTQYNITNKAAANFDSLEAFMRWADANTSICKDRSKSRSRACPKLFVPDCVSSPLRWTVYRNHDLVQNAAGHAGDDTQDRTHVHTVASLHAVRKLRKSWDASAGVCASLDMNIVHTRFIKLTRGR